MNYNNYEYDVALSFAGEQRNYVEKVANALRKYGKSVFYDDFEKPNLWGKDLYEHLNDIYKNKSAYLIMFVSNEYANKKWTTHEKKASQARAFNQSTEYILPVRFDNTEISGLNETVGYLDANEITPDSLAKLFIQKTGSKIAYPIESNNIEVSYQNIMNLWHTASMLTMDNDLIERSQVQVILDVDRNYIVNKIKHVKYYLHPTFENNIKIIDTVSNNFLLKFRAWGSFQLKAEVFLKDEDIPISLYRYINLHTF